MALTDEMKTYRSKLPELLELGTVHVPLTPV